MMVRGDLVHIPQGAILVKEIGLASGNLSDDYLKPSKPVKALFWGRDQQEPKWGFIYYRDEIWTVRMKDIYPINQELENVS
jgi:hypothetical protein